MLPEPLVSAPNHIKDVMLINLFGRWVNPTNILAVVTATANVEEKASKVIFSSGAEGGFTLEIKDKTPTEVASEINAQITASRKSAFADKGERRGGGDRGRSGGGYKGGGDRGGYKGGGDRDRGDRGGYKGGGDRGGYKKRDERPAHGSDEHVEKVREDFSKKKFEGGRKFESKNKGDFRPKKRKEY